MRLQGGGRQAGGLCGGGGGIVAFNQRLAGCARCLVNSTSARASGNRRRWLLLLQPASHSPPRHLAAQQRHCVHACLVGISNQVGSQNAHIHKHLQPGSRSRFRQQLGQKCSGDSQPGVLSESAESECQAGWQEGRLAVLQRSIQWQEAGAGLPQGRAGLAWVRVPTAPRMSRGATSAR